MPNVERFDINYDDATPFAPLRKAVDYALENLGEYRRLGKLCDFRKIPSLGMSFVATAHSLVLLERELSKLGITPLGDARVGTWASSRAGLKRWRAVNLLACHLQELRHGDVSGWATPDGGLYRLILDNDIPCLPDLKRSFEVLGLARDWLSVEIRSAEGCLDPEEARASKRGKKADHQRRKRQQRARPVTPAQAEAVMLVAAHRGNIAAAARAAGVSRAAMSKRYKAALRKAGSAAVKLKQRRLPTDRRGQETLPSRD